MVYCLLHLTSSLRKKLDIMQLQLLLVVILTKVTANFSFNNNNIFNSQNCDVKVDSCRENVDLCDRLCIKNDCSIRAVVLLPNDTSAGAVITLSSVIPALEQAISDAHAVKLLPDWLKIILKPKDDKCSESYAQIGTIEAFSDDLCPHVIFGPICEYAVATVSRIMKFYGTPQLSPGGLSTSFENSKLSCDDEYFMLIRTSSFFFKGISQFFRSLFVKYNWRKIVFLYDPNGQKEVAGMKTCALFMQTLILSLHNIENFQYSDGDVSLSTMNTTEFLKSQIGVNFGVTIMCASYERIRNFLLAAESLGKMVNNGEYVFFNIELTSQASIPEKPWLFGNNTEENNKLKKAYKSVITLTSKTNDRNDAKSGIRTSKFISDFYNSMWLYAMAINSSLNGTEIENNYNTTINGYELVKNMYGTTFIDKNNEIVQINCEGSRVNEYSLLSYNSKKDEFEVVANYAEQNDSITFLEGRKIHWPGGSINPPPDTPTCGYDNSKCPETSLPTYVYISIGLVGFALLIVIIAIFMYRRYKLEAEISSMSWKVVWEDIIDLQNSAIRRDSLSSSIKRGSQVTYTSDLYSLAGDNQIFIPIGFYKNSKVAIKRLAPVKIDLSRKQLLRLKQMKDLHHEHLVRFQGACIDAPNYCILTEYCPKGSLQDILENDQFTLEWMIRISLIQDLVRGMTYLHQSEIKSHGSLSSTNCVVDSRFVLKISDFGMPFFTKLEPPNPDSYAFWRKQLWTAPELLRDPNPPDEGTPKADIYSFGIIVHEIVMRKGLFYLEDGVEHMPKDIINSIKNYVPDVNVMPLRPFIDHSMIEEEVATLMKNCWNEDLIERPDFPALKNLIKKLNKDHDNGNILDNLLSRMEQYANNLESLVEERTADYLEEKKKCEELLYQLLPKSVASQLIRGQSVIAETFEKVTIYFSDIVGFTSLSASSTPMQVVDLLNDLYTCFDSIIENFDVYKVETIGDAYMVVSGLPVRNGDLHSREIARMSLALLEAVQRFTIRHRPEDKLKLRIGLHSGGCVAGVVGLKMPRYCLFGDTVNTASRMESNGEALKIHISPITKEALDIFETFIVERRGDVELKGKGKMTTYWLIGEKKSPENINDITTESNIFERRDSKTISWSSNILDTKSSKLNIINEHKYPKTTHPTKLKSTKSKNNYKNNITSKF